MDLNVDPEIVKHTNEVLLCFKRSEESGTITIDRWMAYMKLYTQSKQIATGNELVQASLDHAFIQFMDTALWDTKNEKKEDESKYQDFYSRMAQRIFDVMEHQHHVFMQTHPAKVLLQITSIFNAADEQFKKEHAETFSKCQVQLRDMVFAFPPAPEAKNNSGSRCGSRNESSVKMNEFITQKKTKESTKAVARRFLIIVLCILFVIGLIYFFGGLNESSNIQHVWDSINCP